MKEVSIFTNTDNKLTHDHDSSMKNVIWCTKIRKPEYTKNGIQPMFLMEGC